MKTIKMLFFTFLMSLAFIIPAFADKLSDLEKKVDSLANNLEELKMDSSSEEESKIHFHGYGELHYNAVESGENEIDMHRMVIGLSYHFTDRILFDMEVDFEHGSQEIELEFAHIDFLINDTFNIRAGAVLVPVGYLNENHEPPLFYSVERPYVQKYIIPTTWQEGGVGIFGQPSPGLRYRAYIVSGLKASGFTASGGIRDGRQKVQRAEANDLAVVGRVELVGIPGLQIGASYYTGEANQDDITLGDAAVTLAEVDGKLRVFDLELTALYAQTDVDETEKLFTATGEVVGEEQAGWYAEAAYHLSLPSPEQDLVAFFRHEEFDTHKTVAPGFTRDLANDREIRTMGLAYYPISNVAIKADYEMWKNKAGENWNVFNLGIGYMF